MNLETAPPPPETTPKGMTFQNINQASAASGWPAAILKACRQAGCGGFRNGKIYLAEVATWYFAHKGDDHIDWNQALKKVKTERERIRLAADRHELIDFSEVSNFHSFMLPMIFGELTRMFMDELPAALKGLDELQIRIKSEQAIEELKKLTKSKIKAWYETHEPPTKPEDTTNANAKT